VRHLPTPIQTIAAAFICSSLLTVPTAFAASIEDFTKYPKFRNVSISPHGKYLAVSHQQDEFEALTVLELPDLTPISTTHFGANTGISNVIWANEERLLIQPLLRIPALLDFRASTGEIFGLDVTGKRFEMLFGVRSGKKQTGTHIRKRKNIVAIGKVIDVMREDPKHVIIQSLGYGMEGTYNEAFRMNVYTGMRQKIAGSPIRNGKFVTDLEHRVNLVSGTNTQGDFEIYTRKPEEFEVNKQLTTPFMGGSLTPALTTTKNGEYLFFDDATSPIRGLVRWDPTTPTPSEVFRHKEVDISNIYTTSGNTIWAIRYIDHYPDYFYPNPEHPFVDLHKMLRASFPNDDVRIISQTLDMKLAVVWVSGPRTPGTYFVLDTLSRKFLHKLDSRPWLKDTNLADMLPIEVKVRDGLKVRAYLTLPPGKTKHLPLVALVHGGPHGISNTWRYDSEVQILAAAGYAVLQVNFRGSGGRGRIFEAAGYGRWGTTMQDDISDVVKFVIADGTVDASRICIFGGSYGGYAALVGAYKTPDLYRCAIGYAGIYDLPLMFKSGDIRTVKMGVNYLRKAVGTDRADMLRRSPVANADKIKAKVMLIHGKIDRRAPIIHAHKMRSALKKSGNDPVWLVEKREGHGFFNEDNRLHMYEQVIEFLSSALSKD